MKVIIMGNVGSLGKIGERELTKKGHKAHIEPDILSEKELKKLMKGYDSLVFDPGYYFNMDYNITNFEKQKGLTSYLDTVLKIAKDLNYKNICILGTYLSAFSKKWDKLDLVNNHPYIKNAIIQEQLAFTYYTEHNMNVSILEIPLVFGLKDNTWDSLAKSILEAKSTNYHYLLGGTAVVTARQVGECIVGALENTVGAVAYPIGWFNLSWKEILTKFSKALGHTKKIMPIPKFIFKRKLSKKPSDLGFNIYEIANLVNNKTYIDKYLIESKLNVKADDLESAIKKTADKYLDKKSK